MIPMPQRPWKSPERKWRVTQTGIGRFVFAGQFHVDNAGALWCEPSDGNLTVFGPGMWIRVERFEEDG